MSATIEEIQAALEAATAAIATERAEVQSALAAQSAKIDELNALLSGVVVPGSVVTPAQLDAILVAANGITAAVADIYTPAV